MDEPDILWEDANLAIWSDGTISIHNPVMGYERCIANYDAAKTRELYEVLRKHYGDEDLKTIEMLREDNRKLRELKIRGVVSEPVKATPPHYDYPQDLG
jgi:hypothetical protein